MRVQLGQAKVTVEFTVDLWYDSPYPFSLLAAPKYELRGRAKAFVPHQPAVDYGVTADLTPTEFTRAFVPTVEQAVLDLTLRAAADVIIPALQDQYTDAVVQGRFRPPV